MADIIPIPSKNLVGRWELSVIVVPDFMKDGTAPEHTHVWLNSMMPPDGTQAQVFRFNYRIAMIGHSIWYQLSELGEELLRVFRRRAGTYQMLENPLLLVGYGLGGLIVKRALSILSDPAMSRPAMQLGSKDVLNLIAGVIFFGTPHTKTKEPEEWCRLTPLLKYAGKFPKRFLAQSEADAKTAAIICEDFENSGLEAPVLSIYETRLTKVRSERWLRKDTVVLVDKALAETWVKKEKLLGNDTSHEEVSSFEIPSPIHQEIGLLLMSALSMSRYNLTAKSIEGINLAQQIDLWEDSISQVSVVHSVPRDALSRIATSHKHDSSEDATVGSSLPSNFDIVPCNDMGEYVAEDRESSTWPCHMLAEFEHKRVFTGREDTFASIDDCFFPPTSLDRAPVQDHAQRLPCCCISGLGGMGKTQTAIQYGLARRTAFDAIFVIPADNPARLSQQFHKIVLALGLSDGVDTSNRGSEEADLIVYRSKALKWLADPKFTTTALAQRAQFLSNATERRLNWLLIFDNVENSTILKDYWPCGDVGCITVTTRDARISNYLRGQSRVAHIYLDGLSTVPASELLLNLSYTSSTESTRADAAVIADKLGGLPLAIEQVAAYIDSKGMTLKEFLKLYEKTLIERRESDIISRSWSYEIGTSWALGNLSAAANSLIQIYSFLDPDGVQDSILTDLLTSCEKKFLPRNYPDDQLSHIDARSELLKSSLVRASMNANYLVIRMHRLVQDISITAMSNLELIEVFNFVCTAIFEAWPFTKNNWDHQAEVWPAQEVLLHHIFRMADIVATYDVGGLDLGIRRKFIKLLSSGGWYRQERGDFDSGVPLFELGIKMCVDSPEFLDLRADLSFALGNVACDTNRWSDFFVHAKDQLNYRLRFDATRGIAPTSNTAIAFSELGIALALMKRYEDAVTNCDKALQLYADQPEVLNNSFFPAFPHIHRALALVGAGRPQEGEQPLLDLIAWHESHFEPSHTEFKLGYAWQCCGLIYARTGRTKESLAAYNKAHANYQATVGPLYHRTGNVCGKIAEHYESLKQFEAADYFFQGAEMAYTSQSHYVPELARHYFIQGRALERRGEEAAANAAFQKAKELYSKVVPQDASVSLSLELLNGIVAPWVW